MARTSDTIDPAESRSEGNPGTASKAAAVGGKLTSSATSALGDRPRLERLAGLLSNRFLGVDLVDLLHELDESDMDLTKLAESDQLERVAGTISDRIGNGNDGGGRDKDRGDAIPETVKKGAATVGALAVVKKLAVPLGLVAVAAAAVLVIRKVRAKRQTTTFEPGSATEARDPYSVRTEASMPGAPPSGL